MYNFLCSEKFCVEKSIRICQALNFIERKLSGLFWSMFRFWPSTQPKNAIPRWYTGRKWHIPMASNRKRSRGRIKAYDMGQGEGPIVPLTVMHRKRVTSELHDSYFRLMTIKHPIQRSSRRSCGRWVII